MDSNQLLVAEIERLSQEMRSHRRSARELAIKISTLEDFRARLDLDNVVVYKVSHHGSRSQAKTAQSSDIPEADLSGKQQTRSRSEVVNAVEGFLAARPRGATGPEVSEALRHQFKVKRIHGALYTLRIAGRITRDGEVYRVAGAK